MFQFRETDYYAFGLRMGVRNLLSQGMRLGLRKTAGKLAQPINSYTRFPEYHFFDERISAYLKGRSGVERARILDLGSPKTFGLYLAEKSCAEIILTDISPSNLDEYAVLWEQMAPGARGVVLFSQQDGRQLSFASGQFDVAYSMSVVEHVEGPYGDTLAIQELSRILRPGGLIVLSVPFGNDYVEQYSAGRNGLSRQPSAHPFFQRIYDSRSLKERILEAVPGIQWFSVCTVSRTNPRLASALGALSMNLRGAIGFLNPILSCWLNRSISGLSDSPIARYGNRSAGTDVYCDVLVAGVRNPSPTRRDVEPSR